MRKLFIIVSVSIFWLVFFTWLAPDDTMQVMAQSSQNARSPAARPAAPAAPAAPAGPAAPAESTPAAAVLAAPPPPQRTETINYDSWTVTCREPLDKPAKRHCLGSLQIVEREKQQEQQRVILSWLIGRDSKGALETVIQTPTGVLIQSGVELKFGDRPPRKLLFRVCEPQRCEASIEMDAAMVREAAAAVNAIVTLRAINGRDVNGRDVNFNVPIKGIDKVISSIVKPGKDLAD